MYEASTAGIQRNVAAVVAAAIVAVGGLILDRAHLASAPEGVVEIGQPTAVESGARIAVLPEVVVTGKKA
ncbi:MAG: hypothetical protein ACT4UQ_01700 [Gammaproteobacteria bacterium]